MVKNVLPPLSVQYPSSIMKQWRDSAKGSSRLRWLHGYYYSYCLRPTHRGRTAHQESAVSPLQVDPPQACFLPTISAALLQPLQDSGSLPVLLAGINQGFDEHPKTEFPATFKDPKEGFVPMIWCPFSLKIKWLGGSRWAEVKVIEELSLQYKASDLCLRSTVLGAFDSRCKASKLAEV